MTLLLLRLQRLRRRPMTQAKLISKMASSTLLDMLSRPEIPHFLVRPGLMTHLYPS
jgi:hypothetical protein